MATVLILSALAPAQAQPSEAEIEVTWHEDNLGFDVNSSKDISNVIVEFCPREDQRVAHKHEAEFEEEDIKNWTHRENETVIAIWVKSGDNHNPDGPQPPAPFNNSGAGEYFENENAECNGQNGECEGPEEIQARNDGQTIVLNWTSVEDAEKYTLYRAEANGTYDDPLVNTTETNYTDEDVEIGTTYKYTVTATIEGEETEACDEAVITAIPDIATVLGGTMALLAGVSSYAVYRRRS